MNEQNAEVYFNEIPVGILSRENGKFIFRYYDSYLLDETKPAISLTLPKRKQEFISDHLFSFFFGLLAEGENKDIQCRMLKIDEDDHFSRLILTAGNDTIGGITVRKI
ncbi:MAG: HipA N-terminal domain-containing protein [Melioribacteraceae bacterium]|nr:HipA N-terminal domain-containing protein [Melioribacteraceae bacterium]MCF8353976.1 HipA N-terminal domain-containing protein [Melioribacteraceae bacterium]MCF8393704.1 HipA N-terminal domain-containing protein [Melioribacteraceae bacterium]MCF8419554.1 HipA N-terminal domain-containing protein [Melioribacteraceae bacterium]